MAWEQQITAYKEYWISTAHKSVILLLHGCPNFFLPFASQLFPPLSIVLKSVANLNKCLHEELIPYSHVYQQAKTMVV